MEDTPDGNLALFADGQGSGASLAGWGQANGRAESRHVTIPTPVPGCQPHLLLSAALVSINKKRTSARGRVRVRHVRMRDQYKARVQAVKRVEEGPLFRNICTRYRHLLLL